MSLKAYGAASDYYRLRLMRVDESDSPDLEWRDDILWRRPPAQDVDEFEVWRVEALDQDDLVTVIGSFNGATDAHEALEAAEADLAEMTRPEFEELYFPADA